MEGRSDKKAMLEMRLERAEFTIFTLKHQLEAVAKESQTTSEHANVLLAGIEAS